MISTDVMPSTIQPRSSNLSFWLASVSAPRPLPSTCLCTNRLSTLMMPSSSFTLTRVCTADLFAAVDWLSNMCVPALVCTCSLPSYYVSPLIACIPWHTCLLWASHLKSLLPSQTLYSGDCSCFTSYIEGLSQLCTLLATPNPFAPLLTLTIGLSCVTS